MDEIQALAAKFDLSLDDLRALLLEADTARGTLTSADLNRGLASVVEIYIRCLASAAARFTDPMERRVAERLVGDTVELLAAQLSAAPQKSN